MEHHIEKSSVLSVDSSLRGLFSCLQGPQSYLSVSASLDALPAASEHEALLVTSEVSQLLIRPSQLPQGRSQLLRRPPAASEALFAAF